MLAWWNARTKGIYVYSMSPFAQKAFHNYFRHDMKELLVRGIKGSARVLPIAFSAYGIIYWANHEYHKRIRKDPKEYEIPDDKIRMAE